MGAAEHQLQQQHWQAVKQMTDHKAAFFDMAMASTGPAGLMATLFVAQVGLSILVLGGGTGQLSEASALDNSPSFVDNDSLKGAKWLAAM